MMLSKDERSALQEYQKSADEGAFALQRLIPSEILYRKGFLDWKGKQYGTHFYRITPAGREALK